MGEAAVAGTFEVPGYELGERIGAGGFGEVFRARQATIDREVAIKVLHAKYSTDPEAVARFVAEARAVARISHPGIVDVHDFGKLADGRQYCVMELVRGRTLRELLRERTRLPLAEALPILRGIAEAIDAAHAAGIAHRDLKPDNVFVTDGGGIKLIDFGLAKLAHQDAPVTETGAVFGTPAYMSPEQCRGKAATNATDAYSLGALAYHVLVGEPPFTGDALELALHHLNDDPEPPSRRCEGLDERVDRVILALLAKDPARRPAPLATALDAIEGRAALPAAPPRKRRRWPIVAGALALAAAGIVLAIWMRPSATASCVSGAGRLDGIWDPSTRSKIAARFAAVDLPDVPGVWKAVSHDMDAYAASWSVQWDAACHEDRDPDPLLHAQRTTCLENALIGLRAASEALAVADVGPFAAGHWDIGFNALDDCTTTAVLRAQLPAPPAAQRAEVEALLVESHRAHLDMHTFVNVRRQLDVDRVMGRLEAAAAKLEALGASAAPEPAYWYAHFRAFIVEGNMRPDIPADVQQKAVAEAFDSAIRRAEGARNDLWLARIYARRAEYAIWRAVPAQTVEELLAKGEAASARAGHPRVAEADLVRARAHHERTLGDIQRALATMRRGAELERGLPETANALQACTDEADYLRAAGAIEETVARRRACLALATDRFGEHHRNVADQRVGLADALARAGQLDDALAETERVIALYREARVGEPRFEGPYIRELSSALQLHRDDVVARAADDLARVRKGIPKPGQEWKGIAGLMAAIGELELADYALDRAVASGLDPELDALRAYLAFMRDRVDDMESSAKRARTIWYAPWLAGYADAVHGHTAAADATLTSLRKALHDPAEHLPEAWLLSGFPRWPEARAALEQALPAFPARNADRAEVLAFLGIARAETGDNAGAATAFEEARLLTEDCCVGFNYYTWAVDLGLARARWDTDHAGAQKLGADALAAATRLGSDKAKSAVQAWLAGHR